MKLRSAAAVLALSVLCGCSGEGQAAARKANARAGVGRHAEDGLDQIQGKEVRSPDDRADQTEKRLASRVDARAHETVLGKPCTRSRPSRPWLMA